MLLSVAAIFPHAYVRTYVRACLSPMAHCARPSPLIFSQADARARVRKQGRWRVRACVSCAFHPEFSSPLSLHAALLPPLHACVPLTYARAYLRIGTYVGTLAQCESRRTGLVLVNPDARVSESRRTGPRQPWGRGSHGARRTGTNPSRCLAGKSCHSGRRGHGGTLKGARRR